MKNRIVQFSAGFNTGDAISNEMLFLKKNFESQNFKSEIYSENIGDLAKKLAKKYKLYSYLKDDILIYHHSIHSSIFDFVKSLPVKKILIYHNVTPHEFFLPYDLKLSYFLKKGREELKELKNFFEYSFADSTYNLQELLDLGYPNAEKLPIHYDFSKLKILERKGSSRLKNIIFVGRIAPNKKHSDLIKIAKLLMDHYPEIEFKLYLVGYCSKELLNYKKELELMIQIFQLEDKVIFSDFIDDEKLFEFYSNADLFLCMSEHEGFCVPLLESIHYGIPIIAFSAGAVKDTLNGSGILLEEKDFMMIAELVKKVLLEDSFKNKIVNQQTLMLEEFKKDESIKKLNDIIWSFV